MHITPYYSCDQIVKNKKGGACSTYGERKNVYRVLVGKSVGKRFLGRPRHRWENNVKLDLQEVVWSRNWIDLAQVRDRRQTLEKR
jgi:hypothetical protein